MNAFDFLRRREIGFASGANKPTRTRRDWRGFFLFLLAGGRTVVMNADLRGGCLNLTRSQGARIANNKFGALPDA